MRNISAVIREMEGPTLPAYSPAEQVGTNVRTRLRAILADHSQFAGILEQTRRSVLPANPSRESLRTAAIGRLDRLRQQISELERELIGIGHNHPPEPLWADGVNRSDFERARNDIEALVNEVNRDTPNPETAQESANRLFEFGMKVALWAGERLTKFVDVALAFLAPVVVAKVTGLAPVIIEALRAVGRVISF